MERHIQRLENDIQNFPKTDDKQDKFVEKMSISFEYIYYFCLLRLKVLLASVQNFVKYSEWINLIINITRH